MKIGADPPGLPARCPEEHANNLPVDGGSGDHEGHQLLTQTGCFGVFSKISEETILSEISQ